MANVMMLGRLVDAAGWRARVVPAQTVAELIAALGLGNQVLAEALQNASVSVVVNDVLMRSDAALSPDDEVAFLPPMSGG